ncbi:MAG: hypothetical protein GF411_02795 [Candidatus Lokiarchaeota archaeon]|nr:hypothetical protein [Candidatus Lokiarchaeota archaeon]
MNTYLIRSHTNYGEVVHIINAENEAEVREFASKCNTVWDGYDIEEVDTKTRGIVAIGGGDS